MGYLEPVQCDAGPIEATLPRTSGAYYLGAIVDEYRWVDELIESNNDTTGR